MPSVPSSKPKPKPKTNRPRQVAPAARKRKSPRGPVAVWGTRIALTLLLVAAVGAAYNFWFRDSSFVAIEKVQVSGLEGGQQAEVEAALTAAAAKMTTLRMQPEVLDDAVEGFVTVQSISVETEFPNTLKVEVEQRHPAVLAVVGGGPKVPVSADGLLMPAAPVGEKTKLPKLRLALAPQGDRLSGDDLARAKVLAATPAPLVPLIERSAFDKSYGVVIELRGDIPIRFGDFKDAKSKWASASAVLADPRVTTLTYLDVRVPERPAVGGAVPA